MRGLRNAGRIVLMLMLALPVEVMAQVNTPPGQHDVDQNPPAVTSNPSNPGATTQSQQPSTGGTAVPGRASFTVVPGLGIGQWPLDGKLADYIWVMGDTIISDIRPSGTDLPFRQQLEEKSWQAPRIFVVYPPASDTVWAVGTAEPAAQTMEHVGVGSTEAQATGAYQAPQFIQTLPLRSRTLIYDSRGIAFEYAYVPATGQFASYAGRLFVFRPGQARAIWRLP